MDRSLPLTAVIVVTTVLTLFSHPGSAQAGWGETWAGWKQDFYRNNCWPEPFASADRAAAQAPWGIMINNGWRLNNTIHDHLFDESHQLTHAGVLKLRWIATQAVEPRRVVFVLVGPNREATEQRMDSVQRAVADIVPEGPLPQVLLTTKVPRVGSGDYFDQVDRKARESIPAPVLPAASNPGGSSN